MNKENIFVLMILESVIMALLFVSYEIDVKQVEQTNNALTEEKSDLEFEIIEKDNELYKMALDLKVTEKALADTSAFLDQMQDTSEVINYEYIGEYKCTAYCCEKYPHICGGGKGITASGQPIQPDVSVAVGDLKLLPYGTVIYIEDVGIRIVQDTGKLGKHQIDVAVDTHDHASTWEGQGNHKVWILKEGDVE